MSNLVSVFMKSPTLIHSGSVIQLRLVGHEIAGSDQASQSHLFSNAYFSPPHTHIRARTHTWTYTHTHTYTRTSRHTQRKYKREKGINKKTHINTQKFTKKKKRTWASLAFHLEPCSIAILYAIKETRQEPHLASPSNRTLAPLDLL